MFERSRPGVVCVLLLVGTMAFSCTCPTGTYQSQGLPWKITTIGGNITGTIAAGYECGGDLRVTGTSDGTHITFRAESTSPYSPCCSPIDFEATANEDCSELVGTFSFPPESSCYPGSGDAKWTKMTSLVEDDLGPPWIRPQE